MGLIPVLHEQMYVTHWAPGNIMNNVCELLLLVVTVGVVEVFTIPCISRFTELEAISFFYQMASNYRVLYFLGCFTYVFFLVIWLLMAFVSASSRSILLSATLSFEFNAFNHRGFIDQRTCIVVVACKPGWGPSSLWMAYRREAQKRTIYFSSRASNSPFDVIYKRGCTHNHCIGCFNSIQLLFADIKIIPQYVTFFWHFFFFFFFF